jgi:hypothetical protein
MRHLKVIAKYVTVEAVKNTQVLTLLFLDWNSRRDCLEVVKMHGMKPLTSATGSKGLEMALEDINADMLKCEIGAEIPHDFMLDGDDFTDAYKERSVSNG